VTVPSSTPTSHSRCYPQRPLRSVVLAHHAERRIGSNLLQASLRSAFSRRETG